MDKVKRRGVSPLGFDIVDFELDVWRSPSRLNGRQVVAELQTSALRSLPQGCAFSYHRRCRPDFTCHSVQSDHCSRVVSRHWEHAPASIAQMPVPVPRSSILPSLLNGANAITPSHSILHTSWNMSSRSCSSSSLGLRGSANAHRNLSGTCVQSVRSFFVGMEATAVFELVRHHAAGERGGEAFTAPKSARTSRTDAGRAGAAYSSSP